jgi:hypothetical protein
MFFEVNEFAVVLILSENATRVDIPPKGNATRAATGYRLGLLPRRTIVRLYKTPPITDY